jgi:hypothetical protein
MIHDESRPRKTTDHRVPFPLGGTRPTGCIIIARHAGAASKRLGAPENGRGSGGLYDGHDDEDDEDKASRRWAPAASACLTTTLVGVARVVLSHSLTPALTPSLTH